MRVIVANGSDINLSNKNVVGKCVYAPISSIWSEKSPMFKEVIERFKDVPLVRYKPTEYDLKMMAIDPEWVENMPRWVVPKFDRMVSSADFEKKLFKEFYDLFMAETPWVIALVRKHNKAITIII